MQQVSPLSLGAQSFRLPRFRSELDGQRCTTGRLTGQGLAVTAHDSLAAKSTSPVGGGSLPASPCAGCGAERFRGRRSSRGCRGWRSRSARRTAAGLELPRKTCNRHEGSSSAELTSVSAAFLLLLHPLNISRPKQTNVSEHTGLWKRASASFAGSTGPTHNPARPALLCPLVCNSQTCRMSISCVWMMTAWELPGGVPVPAARLAGVPCACQIRVMLAAGGMRAAGRCEGRHRQVRLVDDEAARVHVRRRRERRFVRPEEARLVRLIGRIRVRQVASDDEDLRRTPTHPSCSRVHFQSRRQIAQTRQSGSRVFPIAQTCFWDP